MHIMARHGGMTFFVLIDNHKNSVIVNIAYQIQLTHYCMYAHIYYIVYIVVDLGTFGMHEMMYNVCGMLTDGTSSLETHGNT